MIWSLFIAYQYYQPYLIVDYWQAKLWQNDQNMYFAYCKSVWQMDGQVFWSILDLPDALCIYILVVGNNTLEGARTVKISYCLICIIKLVPKIVLNNWYFWRWLWLELSMDKTGFSTVLLWFGCSGLNQFIFLGKIILKPKFLQSFGIRGKQILFDWRTVMPKAWAGETPEQN